MALYAGLPERCASEVVQRRVLFRCAEMPPAVSDWPRDREASFRTLRAYGAFLVSAWPNGAVVKSVKILRGKGRPCVVENPWPGQHVQRVCLCQSTQTLAGQPRFDTAPEE
jgi:hypothetical protein